MSDVLTRWETINKALQKFDDGSVDLRLIAHPSQLQSSRLQAWGLRLSGGHW